DPHPRRASVLEPALDAVGRRGQGGQRAGGQGRRQTRPLPEILMIHLGDRRSQTGVQLGLDRRELAALGLETAGLWKVQVDHEQGDKATAGHGRAQESSRSTCRVAYVSITSSSFTSA